MARHARRASERGPLAGALAAVLALAIEPAQAAAAEDERRRHPLLPDHAKVQFAGAIGLLSAGPGYAFAGRKLELDVLVGWVPASITDVDLFTLTGKFGYLPWTVHLPDRWRLRPLTASLAVTYTFGDRFSVFEPSGYPSGYHPLPTALRGTVAVGATIGRASVGSLEQVGLSLELVSVDLPLAFWIRNRDAVRASDVVSVALGVRAEF